jgi:hypothetical protein
MALLAVELVIGQQMVILNEVTMHRLRKWREIAVHALILKHYKNKT